MRRLDDEIRRFEPLVAKLPLSRHLFSLYRRVSRPLFSYAEVGEFAPGGVYTVSVGDERIEDFEVVVTDGAPHDRQKILGTYEQPVLEAIADEIDEDTVFWEIGGGSGYFSMAVADTAREVYVFEKSPSAIERIETGIAANDHGNVTVVQGNVVTDSTFEAVPEPDLVLLDVDGWELKALQSMGSLLETVRPTWIVEVHDPEKSDSLHQDTDPAEVEGLFRTNDYALETILKRLTNYHVVARP